MCGGNCANCPKKQKAKLPKERLEPNKKHVVRVQVDTESVDVGAEAHIKIGNGLVLVIVVETATDVSFELREVGD